MGRQLSTAIGFTLGAVLALGSATASRAAPTAPHAAPVPPAAPFSPPIAVTPGYDQLGEADRATIREALEASRDAMAAAETARNREFAAAMADRDMGFAELGKAMRMMWGDIRAVLIGVRAMIANMSGMGEEDRRRALSGIDKALAALDRQRGPALR